MNATNVKLLAGPQVVGTMFNWALEGILIAQVYVYHTFFPDDELPLKSFVYGVFAFETVQAGLIMQAMFSWDVYDYGNVQNLTSFQNTWFSVPVMSALVSAAVQIFFGWRIWITSRSNVLFGMVIVLALGQMSVGILGGVKLKTLDPSAASASAVTPIISSWLGLAALVDVIIAVCMTIILLRARSGISRTDAIIGKIIGLVIETGSLTAAVAILDIIFFTVFPNTLLHECPAVILPKLYANSLLANLNSRIIFRLGNGAASTAYPSSRTAFSKSIRSSTSRDTRAAEETIGQVVHVSVLNETFASDDIPLDDMQKTMLYHADETKDVRPPVRISDTYSTA